MLKPSLPANEAQRLQCLRTLQILDTPPDPALDAVTSLLADQLHCPIALLTLVDDQRQWFKSRHGLATSETPREEAFCAHAILQNDQFLVPDSHQDERFFDNPLVTGEPRVRFYAGQPLRVDGHAVGTLCVIDHGPRQWDATQARLLSGMGTVVEALLTTSLPGRTDTRRREQMEFFARVSHELRTPLNAILSFNQLLQDELAQTLAPYQLRWLQLMQQGGQHLLALTDDILTLSQREHRALPLAPLTLQSAIAESVSFIGPLALEARMELRVDQDDPQLQAIADRQALRQVLLNVVSNAIKYSPAGSVVRLNVAREGERAVIDVIDQGSGIPADRLDRLFLPFERLGAEKGFIPGTGLGLAIAKTLVEAMQGRISAEASADGGCRIRIALPMPADKPAEAPAPVIPKFF